MKNELTNKNAQLYIDIGETKMSAGGTITTNLPQNTNQWSWSYKMVNPNSLVIPEIQQVIINDRTTIINWKDGTKTRSTCDVSDIFNPEVGFALCVIKKLFGKKRYGGYVQKAVKQNKNRIHNKRNQALKILSSGTAEEFAETISRIPEAIKNIENKKKTK